MKARGQPAQVPRSEPTYEVEWRPSNLWGCPCGHKVYTLRSGSSQEEANLPQSRRSLSAGDSGAYLSGTAELVPEWTVLIGQLEQHPVKLAQLRVKLRVVAVLDASEDVPKELPRRIGEPLRFPHPSCLNLLGARPTVCLNPSVLAVHFPRRGKEG